MLVFSKRFYFGINFISACRLAYYLLVIFSCVAGSLNAQLPSGFIRERIAEGLNPTSIVTAPDGRIFITEKQGVVRIIRDDILLDEPFLTLEVDDSNERGLGHMVFHPDFDINGYVYIFYAVPGVKHNRISRFTANGDKVIPGSELIIMELDEMGSDIHNGGDMVFGSDGYLYVATGDGGQNWRGEDLGNTNAKVLRMDDEGHAVPDNPYYTSTYLRAKYVYAFGLRNPFTMIQHPITGEIYVNDVGGSQWEEINRIERGAFYGWPKLEGKRTTQEVPPEYQDPLYAYRHINYYCCIVGSAIYTPTIQQFPSKYVGKYFYSDYCTGNMHYLNLNTGVNEGIFMYDGDRVIDIEVAQDGSLYYLERKGLGDGSSEDNTATDEGTLWKVTYTGSGAPFISIHPQSQLIAVGEDAVFSVQTTGNAPLTFTWYVNDAVAQQGKDSIFVITDGMADQDSSLIFVEISNSISMVSSKEAILRVTSNHRPQAVIHQPLTNTTYTAGTEIFFSGIGQDEEDGIMAASAMSWRIDFHHGTHSHPALSWISGIDAGSYVIPSTGETAEDVWYRISMRVTDTDGLMHATYRDIFPVLGAVGVQSEPSGLKIGLDGKLETTPFFVEGVRGVNRYLSPPEKQVHGDSIYFFEKWNDGSTTLNRGIKTSEEEQIFVASFISTLKGKGYGLTATYFDNMDFIAPPIGTAIDSMINYNFLGGAPIPDMPIDFFSVQWDGYVQPVRSGNYTFTVFSEDGAALDINGTSLFEDFSIGYHNISNTIYLEGGRLYPIRLRFQEFMYNCQIRLRWSCEDFVEEPIPSSQLYPADYLSSPDVFGIKQVETLVSDHLHLSTESYLETIMQLRITDITGRIWEYERYRLPIGKGIVTVQLDFLPPGTYFLEGMYAQNQEPFLMQFVKVR